jgi:DNA repair protein RecN (Recombination protein N)
MLLSLEVRDFVIVDHLALEFDTGFTVLTGETGAGKSILIDALALVLGGRPDPGVVRAGRERAEISALFALPQATPAAPSRERRVVAGAPGATDDDQQTDDEAASQDVRGWLTAQGFDCEDEQVLLRRSLDAGGRSRCWIAGRSATTQQLREVGAALLDIHGQHAHQSLLRVAAQRDLLDAYAGALELAASVQQAWLRWRAAERELERWAERDQALAAEREALEREAQELGTVALPPAAWADLQAEQSRLAHAHSLLASAQWSVERLAEGDGGDALGLLHAVSQRLADLEDIDASLAAPRELIDSAAISVAESVHVLRRYVHTVEGDPERLSAVEEQMQRVLACARRYRLGPEDLQQRLAEVRLRLEELGGSASRGALEQACRGAQVAYQTAAMRLSKLRNDAAVSLAEVVTKIIRELAMGEGAFSIALTPLNDGSAHGSEQVEFCLAAFPGQPPAPLARIASGGELSRVSLAVQTALSQVARVPTLIFDEVDTGIGGRVAEIVGRLLHQVARRCQVMCVTHLPQVAAWADHHLQVAKQPGQGAPVSRITVLGAAERVDEVARMLGGITLTETSRQHARELLAARQGAR